MPRFRPLLDGPTFSASRHTCTNAINARTRATQPAYTALAPSSGFLTCRWARHEQAARSYCARVDSRAWNGTPQAR
eukprot:6470746-Prymnesium_polylepis.1